MLKKSIVMLLTLSMVVGISGCGSSNSGSASTAAATSVASAGETSGNSGSAEAADTSGFTPVTLKMGNQHSADTVANQLDLEMCERIKEATEGRVTIELYSDSALGDYTNVFDELMLGTVDVAHISPVETYDARVSATMLPYLAFDYDTLLKVYAEGSFLREELNDALDALGIRLMGVFCEGFNGIAVKQELTDPDVVGAEKGCIIRSPMMDVYSLELMDMGFRVSSMPYSDTYTAIQTGVVAGLAGGTSQIAYLAFRDLITDFYDYRYIQEATMIMFSQKTWDSLLPQDQDAITEIVNEICEEGAIQAESACDEYMTKLEEGGH
ncbi:MAG: TRAP transporter substrate-binding protein DctP [Clostridiales bacterium]|nr:TRAP transporter substrate-binding protein DctP [Clostridiales bacterium]